MKYVSPTLTLCEAALFNREPLMGSVNPPGEVAYAGYRRVPAVAAADYSIPIVFPACEQDAPVFATHVALLDGAGKVVAVEALGAEHVR